MILFIIFATILYVVLDIQTKKLKLARELKKELLVDRINKAREKGYR